MMSMTTLKSKGRLGFSASRREFLGGIAAAAAAGGCRSLFGEASFYGPTIREDRKSVV